MDLAVCGNQVLKETPRRSIIKSNRESNDSKDQNSSRSIQSAHNYKNLSNKHNESPLSSGRSQTGKVRNFSVKTPDSSRSKLSSRSVTKRGMGTFNLPKKDQDEVAIKRGGDLSLFLDLKISADDDVKRKQRAQESYHEEKEWEEISITSGRRTEDTASSRVMQICKAAFESETFSKKEPVKEEESCWYESVKSISNDGDTDRTLLYEEDSELCSPKIELKNKAQYKPPIKISQNMAASRIQIWYRRHLKRRRMAEAAMKRLFTDKQNQLKHTEPSLQVLDNVKRSVPNSRSKIIQQSTTDLLSDNRRSKTNSALKKKQDQIIAEQEVEKLKIENKIPSRPSSAVSTNRSKNTKTPTQRKDVTIPETTPRSIKNTVKQSEISRSLKEHNKSIESTPRSTREVIKTKELKNNIENKNEEINDEIKSGRPEGTVTTIDDILSTIKELESIECLTDRSQNRKGWNNITNDINRLLEPEKFPALSNLHQPQLTTESLDLHNKKIQNQDNQLNNNSSEHLDQPISDTKMSNILKFLRSSEIHEELLATNDIIDSTRSQLKESSRKSNQGTTNRTNNWNKREHALLEENAQSTINEITTTITTLRLELEEKQRSQDMLQKALQQQRELTVRQVKETQKDMEKRINHQKEEYETALQRNHTFIDQLISKNELLQDKCNKLVVEIKDKTDKYDEKLKLQQENHSVEIKKLDAKHAAGEKIRREKWESEKTKMIKEMTIKGMETELAQLIGNHKQEMRRMKQYYENELMKTEENCYEKYTRQIDELRKQMYREKEDAIQKEQDISKERFEQEIQRQVQILEAQRKQLYQEISDERERLNLMATKQKTEVENLRKQLEFKEDKVGETLRLEQKHEIEELKRKHENEIRDLKSQQTLEHQIWMETEKKKNEAYILNREQELKQEMKRKRDEEIEKVIVQLEKDGSQSKEDLETSYNNKLKRAKDKYEAEIKELESSERQAKEKYNQMRAEFLEMEGDHESLKVIMKQKEKEIGEIKQLYETLHRERSHVSDVIRQEFADRLVSTDEENRQLKREISEMRAKLTHMQQSHEQELVKQREGHQRDMDEVHSKVKEAIKRKEENMADLRNQFQNETEKWQEKITASEKRAEHLEGLLEQQRKQLLKLK